MKSGLKSIRGKLLAGFGIVVALCCVVGAISYMDSGNVVNTAEELNQDLWPAADGIMMYKASQQREVHYLHGYLLSGKEELVGKIKQANKKQEEYLKQVKESDFFDEEYSKLKQLDDQSDAAVSKIIDAYQAGNEEKWKKVKQEELHPTLEEITSLANSMDEKIDKQMGESTEALSATSTDTQTMAMGATIVAAVAGFGIAIFTSNTISRNINEVAQVAQRIGKGEHSARSEVKSEDEVGHLAESVNKMGENIANSMAEANVAAEYIDRISKGDIPEYIQEDWQGDFAEVKNNLNQCIKNFNWFVSEMNRMSDGQNAGKGTYMKAHKFMGVKVSVKSPFSQTL